jgi:S1-C subfamily serine protease
VIVSEIDEYSPAWHEGLRAETAITHVDGVRVTSPKEFHAAVAGKTGPVTLRLIGAGDDHASLVVPPDPPAAPAETAPAGDKSAAAAGPPADGKAVGPRQGR